MNTPRFTAESGLYKTSRHYRTHSARQAVSSSAQMMSPIHPALKDEDIEIHDCKPPFIKVGEWPNMTCVYIPPGGAGGGGEDLPPGGRPDDGDPYGKGKGYETLEDRMKRLRPPGRYCKPLDFPGGRDARDKAEQACASQSKGKQNLITQLVCRDHPDRTVSSGCCHFSLTKDGRRFKDPVICYHAEEMPPK